jgi:hypothetical protein
MIDTLEVVDHITADCIEVGDVVRFTARTDLFFDSYDEILTVTSFDDRGDFIVVKGVSEVSGDSEEYEFLADDHLALMAEPVEEI